MDERKDRLKNELLEKALSTVVLSVLVVSLGAQTGSRVQKQGVAVFVEQGDQGFESHAAWMAQSHYREGEKALLRYNVVKGPELSNPWDPSSDPTGNTCSVLMEVYESEAGVEDHWIPSKSQRNAVNRLPALSRGRDNGQAEELAKQLFLPSNRNPAATRASFGFFGCGFYFS